MSRESSNLRLPMRTSEASLPGMNRELATLTANSSSRMLSRGQTPMDAYSEESPNSLGREVSEYVYLALGQIRTREPPRGREGAMSSEQMARHLQPDNEEEKTQHIPNQQRNYVNEPEENGSSLMQTDTADLYQRMIDAEELFKQLRREIRGDGDIATFLQNKILIPEKLLHNQDGQRVSRDPREKAKTSALEALKQKDLNHGRNLLMYAAYEGALTSFNSLVKVVRKEVSLKTLAKQLRDFDVFGAPLLLQAASSSNLACFRAVAKVIRRTLGLGELRLQLLAKDLKNRTIIFYAATSKMVDVFDEVTTMLKTDAAYKGENPAKDYSWLTVKKEELLEEGERQEIERNIFSQDERGMNVLHHACQAGSADVLDRVLSEAIRLGWKFAEAYLHTWDKRGRTAILHVLRAYYKPRENRSFCHYLKTRSTVDRAKIGDQTEGGTFLDSERDKLFSEMKREETSLKLKMLIKVIMLTAKVDPDASAWGVLTTPALIDDNGGLRYEARPAAHGDNSRQKNKTALMLAAHGGADQLDIAQEILFDRVFREKREEDGRLDLDLALGTPDGSCMEIRERWRGNLLEEAAAGGDKHVLKYVVNVVQTGLLYNDRCTRVVRDNGIDILKKAIDSVTDYRGTLFTVVISSRSIAGVKFMISLFKRLFEPEELWDLLAGSKTHINNLTAAASIPISEDSTSKPTEMFETVYGALEQAAKDFKRDGHMELLRGLLFLENESEAMESRTPLGGAMLSSNVDVFDKVLKTYKILARDEDWTRRQILWQIPIENDPRKKDTDKLYSRASKETPIDISPRMLISILKMIRTAPLAENETTQLRELMTECMRRVVQLAAERGAFRQFRVVANGDEQLLLLETIPSLLERIGDDEGNIIEAIMAAVKYARNCFVAGAWASMCIEDARTDFRIHKVGLDRLERQIDVLSQAVLEALPHTLQGVGKTFAAHELEIVKFKRKASTRGTHDHFSRKLGFVVTEWMLEPETGPDPRNEDTALEESKGPDVINPLEHALGRGSAALHFINSPLVLDYMSAKFSRSLPAWNRNNPFDFSVDEKYFKYTEWDTHVFPGPETTVGETGADGLLRVMIVLFGMSVTIEKPDVIPKAEIIFYTFIAGLTRREFLEFQEINSRQRFLGVNQDSSARLKPPANRIALIISRYLFEDAWNILDTATIFTVTAALIFRLVALNEAPRSEESVSFFMAQILLAASSPLLFARILSLSQIDSTLGPMTQIIWTMLSHLAQFSIFILVLIVSFALTFHILLSGCIANADNQADDVDEAFGAFPDAMLSMFRAMLGDFNFDSFRQCSHPPLAAEAGIGLLALYLVIVAILLLNLLIAILSTVHAEVYQNADKEFNLSRAKLIQHSCRSVSNGRQPTPINLLAPIAGLMVDIFSAVWYFIYHYSLRRCRDNIPFCRLASETDTWKAFIGMIHRLIFVVIMGPVAFLLLAVLWIVSLPWIAWCFLRSRPQSGEQAPPLTGCSSSLVKQKAIESFWKRVFPRTDFWKDIEKFWKKGYLGPLVAAVFVGIGWAFSFIPAIIVSTSCIILSAFLFWYGIMDIGKWWRRKDFSRLPVDNTSAATNYETIEKMVSRLNGCTNKGSKHFGVEGMLKMTTGLDVEDIWLRAKWAKFTQARMTGDSEVLGMGTNLPSSPGLTSPPTWFDLGSVSNPNG